MGKILVGRPKLQVDLAIVLRIRDVENLGWSRAAEEYQKLMGTRISRDSFKRRYFEAKSAQGCHYCTTAKMCRVTFQAIA